MKSIQEAIKFIFEICEGIHTKIQLDVWCGNRGREKLYSYIKELAPVHWNQLENQNALVEHFIKPNCFFMDI